ncbi:MAG TPA: YbaK/EbsC family protein [Mycobacteriales bacterium]|nr:YbaK/EbsC family protein [Mycobacteriales bacterium]
MKGTLDIHRELLVRDVPHEVVRLPRLVLAADELPEALGLPADRCVAVRVYLADEDLVAVLVRAGDVPDPARLLTLLRARTLRVADADLINASTDYAAGLVAPLLLPPEVTVLCDAAVPRAAVVYVPTGESGTAVGIPTEDLLAVTGARVAELCNASEPLIELPDLDGDPVAGPPASILLPRPG